MSRIAFLGTPDAAVVTLASLAADHDIGLVVTQPDRPKGRSRTPTPSPVGVYATGLGIPVSQPSTKTEILEGLQAHGPFDVGVVVAYGRILTPEMLGTARLGYVNIHFSLLPRWRGAAPVERAIMAGDPMTGVTIILLDEGLDTGPVLNAQAVDIADFVTGGELTSVLAGLGARLVVKTLPDYVSGQVTAIRQVSDGATYARKLAPSDRPVRIDEDRVMTINRIRALAPRPGATLEIDGETFKILEASRVDLAVEPGRWESIAGVPVFGCSDGALEIRHLQPPGRRVVTGASWLRGLRRTAGVVA